LEFNISSAASAGERYRSADKNPVGNFFQTIDV